MHGKSGNGTIFQQFNLLPYLSVEEQQRVAVARALIGKPKIIISDEPTSALDSSAKSSFMNLLFRQVDAQKSTLIFAKS